MSHYRLKCGDMREVLRKLPDNYVHSVVCDPPYELHTGTGKGFMGQALRMYGARSRRQSEEPNSRV